MCLQTWHQISRWLAASAMRYNAGVRRWDLGGSGAPKRGDSLLIGSWRSVTHPHQNLNAVVIYINICLRLYESVNLWPHCGIWGPTAEPSVTVSVNKSMKSHQEKKKSKSQTFLVLTFVEEVTEFTLRCGPDVQPSRQTDRQTELTIAGN